MAGFFRPDLLNTTRTVMLGPEAGPDLIFHATSLGFSKLPDFSMVAAITFGDVAVSHTPFTKGLLFHELVHVEQYHQLGIRRSLGFVLRIITVGGTIKMRIAIGFLLAFLIGAGCRFFRIPSPAPNAILGALLVVAMSVGYGCAGYVLR
jgi:XapX domain-containing protein